MFFLRLEKYLDRIILFKNKLFKDVIYDIQAVR